MSKSMKDLLEDARSRIDISDPADVHAARQNGDIVLDVREPAELESDGTVDGAIRIPRGLVEAQADPDTGNGNNALIAKRNGGGRVHVLCASGARAALAADSLCQMGYDATAIEGGLDGWKKASLPINI